MKTTRSFLLSLLLLGPAAVPLPAQLLFDFDAAGDLSGFSERGVSGGTQFSVNTTLTGIGGASGVLLASQNADETIVYTGLGGTTTWAATPSITTSIFFQYLGTFPSATLVYAQIGLMSSANSSFNTGNNNGGDGANNDYASVRVRYQNPAGFELQGQSVVGDSNSANNYNTVAGLSNLTLSNWYRLEGTFSRNGTANVLNYSASLVDFGANGTVSGNTISSISGTQSVSASLYSDSTALYSGLRSTIGTGQGYLDNYTLPVPEPSSALLLLGASAAIVATRRRRV